MADLRIDRRQFESGGRVASSGPSCDAAD